MNRQAITFLTLFTLVLMLAVYYVTLPLDDPTISNHDILVSQEEPIEKYKDTLEEKYNSIVKESESVLSSNESTLQEKLNALQEITKTEKISTIENNIIDNLTSLGYQGCFVEIEEEVTRVICPKTYIGKTNALKIIEETYQFIEEGNLVEVSFE